MIDVTLACEDVNSKLVDVVTVADEVLATICCRFRSWGLVKKLNFCSDFEHKVWSNFLSLSSDKIWSWSLISFFCWCFVEVMLNPFWILVNYLKLGFVKILKLKFYGEADVWLWFWSWCLVEILRWSLIKICFWTWDKNSTLGSVVPLAMFFLLMSSLSSS